jgi:tripartite-type tricarboxylate transporter receptor subunit TctC
MKTAGLAAFAAALIGGTFGAAAQGYPNRAVTIVVPFPAGGTADILPRLIAEKLRTRWKQPVIVENRPGAAGTSGSAAVANAAPDGYTLLATPAGPLVINKLVQKSFPFEPLDMAPITVFAEVPTVLAVRLDFPASSVAEFVAYARAHPGKLNYASQGPGSTSHLTGVMFQLATGVEMVHVPYKGSNPALTDLISGNVDLMFDNLASSVGYHEAGKLKILAVATRNRATLLPDMPTLHESGLPDFHSSTWFALVAPSGTPPDLTERINRDVAEILKMDDVRTRLDQLGLTPVGSNLRRTKDFLGSEAQRWERVVKAANLPKE